MLEQRKKLKKLLQKKSANEAINNLQFVFALWLTNLKGRCPSWLWHTRIARAGCAFWEPGDAQLLLKAERTILQDSYFIRLVPRFQNSHKWEPAECPSFLQIYRRDFPLPPWCLEHVCILPQGIPKLSVECVQCPQLPATLGRAEFLGLQLLLQKS